MKTINKLIKENYLTEQKGKIKERIGIVTQHVKPTPKTTKLFIPSLLSLCVSFILIITSTILFINSQSENPQTTLPPLEKHLKTATIGYIKSPIETILIPEQKMEILIYYGLSGDPLIDLKNHLVIDFIAQDEALIKTKVWNEDALIVDESSLYKSNGNNLLAFDTDVFSLNITFKIDDVEKGIRLDLNNYYQYLIN